MRSTRVEISSRIRRAFLFVGTGLVGACSLVVDTSGLTGGSRDAGREGSVVDAPVTSDVSVPDASVADARWCETHGPDGGFCDDFDDPGRTDPVLHWDTLNATAGTMTVVPPGVLQADWPANVTPPDNDCSYLRLIKDMPGPITKWTYGFDIFLEAGFFDDAITDMVWRSGSNAYCQLYLHGLIGQKGDPSLSDGDSERPLTQPISTGAWHRFEISVDSNAGSVAITIDGANGFASPQTIVNKCKGPSKVSVLNGLFCAQKSPGAERVLYDNVTFAGE